MDFGFIHQVIPLYEKAAILTLKAGLAGVVLSIALGLFCAVIRYWKIPVAKEIVKTYTELSRNTPLLIQLFTKAIEITKSLSNPVVFFVFCFSKNGNKTFF